MALLTSKTRVKPKFTVSKRQQQEAKKSRDDELDELVVVGYACKLFRDDTRAREIDRGTHLIPWMGDESLKIDRYDGRGHLHNLSDFEEVAWNEDHQLSVEAARIEAICDEERYMALHTDLLEAQTRQEEELKRLDEAIREDEGYRSVAFSYGQGTEDYDPMQPTEDETEIAKRIVSHENRPPPAYKVADTTTAADLEEPFIAPPELKLPPGMEQPQTLKMHIIIEKTAMFVSSQGTQMEIVVKTKQANNPQFDFLKFDHYLNPYYKLLVNAIKSKRYIPIVMREESKNGKKKQDESSGRRSSNSNSIQSDDEEDDMEGSGYLHPSLFAPPRPKPAAVHSQQHPPPGLHPPDHIPPHLGPHQGEMLPMMDPNHPQPLIMGYYEVDPVTTSATFHMPGPHLMGFPPLPPDHMETGNPLLGPPIHPPPGFIPGEPVPGPIMPHHHPALVPPMHEGQPLPLANPSSVLGPPLISQEMPIPHPPAEESAILPPHPPIVPPPPDIQPIIDKLAKYVAKNGDDFEVSVRSKNDPRFSFLDPLHSFNMYYLTKKQMFIDELSREGAEEERGMKESKDGASNDGAGGNRDPHSHGSTSGKSKKVPVRFPIKMKKTEERTLERRSALPVESSSDSNNDEDDDDERQYKSTSSSDNQQARSMMYGRARSAEVERQYDVDEGRGQEMEFQEEFEDELMEPRENFRPVGGQQQKLEDRLAAAARKKLASTSQKHGLQVERRKKLALFLSQVKDRPPSSAAATQEGGVSEADRETGTQGDIDRSRSSYGKPQSPAEVGRGERTSSPARTSHSSESRSHSSDKSESRSHGSEKRKRVAPVPRSYQTAVNMEVLERERWRKRSRSPERKRRTPPPPLPLPTSITVGPAALHGRTSTASPVLVSERDYPVSSPGSDSRTSQSSTQSVPSEPKTESKGGSNDFRAKIRAMIAATMDLRKDEDVG